MLFRTSIPSIAFIIVLLNLLSLFKFSAADIVDDLLWDKEVLRKLQHQVDTGQQTDPYALRYFQWLKQREHFDLEKKQKDAENQKRKKQQEAAQETRKRKTAESANSGNQKQQNEKQPQPQSREGEKDVVRNEQIHEHSPGIQRAQQHPQSKASQSKRILEPEEKLEGRTRNDARMKAIQDAILKQLEYAGTDEQLQEQHIVVVTIPGKSDDTPIAEKKEHLASEDTQKKSKEIPVGGAATQKGLPRGVSQRNKGAGKIGKANSQQKKETQFQNDEDPKGFRRERRED
jgi:hypothetical protein